MTLDRPPAPPRRPPASPLVIVDYYLTDTPVYEPAFLTLVSHHTDANGAAFVVYEATPADAQAVLAHTRTVLAENHPGVTTSADEFRLDVDEEADYLGEHLRDPHRLILIATRPRTGQVVGLLRGTTDVRARVRHTMDIGLSVLPTCRRAGIGRALVGRVVRHAAAHAELAKLTIGILEDNPGAKTLFEALGFATEGRRVGYHQRGDRFVDQLLMYRWVRTPARATIPARAALRDTAGRLQRVRPPSPA